MLIHCSNKVKLKNSTKNGIQPEILPKANRTNNKDNRQISNLLTKKIVSPQVE